MASRTRWLIVGGTTATVLVVAVLGWLVWRYGQAAYWVYVSSQALDDAEVAALQACEDPGWAGLLKVLEQDLDTSCPATWFAERAVEHAKPRHRQRARWMRAVLADTSRSARTRFRAGSALLLSGREGPPDLVILGHAAGIDELDLVNGIQSGSWPESFADPALRHRVRVHDVAPDAPGALVALVGALRHAAVVPVGDAPANELRESALEALDIDAYDISEVLDRRAAGLALGMYPEDLVRLALAGGERCVGHEGPPSTGCLLWLADGLEEQAELRPADPSTSVSLSACRALWEVREDQDPGRVALLVEAFDATGAWIAELEDADARAVRLAAVVWGVPAAEAEGASTVGGMESVLAEHTGLPWSRAALALVLGELSDVEVAAGTGPEGVWLSVGDQIRWLGPCGETIPVDLEQARSEPWPAGAVLAQLGVEEAGLALEANQPDTARRVTLWAQRMDGLGTEGFVALKDEAATPASAAVAHVVSLLPSADPPEGAEEARRERAAWLRSSWTGTPACP